MLECHLCPARFYDDNSAALHMGRHRALMYGWPEANEGARQTNKRQAERAMIEDLLEILHG